MYPRATSAQSSVFCRSLWKVHFVGGKFRALGFLSSFFRLQVWFLWSIRSLFDVMSDIMDCFITVLKRLYTAVLTCSS